jgi:hypothetical protein
MQGVDDLGHGAIKVLHAYTAESEEDWEELTVNEVRVEGDNIFIVVE